MAARNFHRFCCYLNTLAVVTVLSIVYFNFFQANRKELKVLLIFSAGAAIYLLNSINILQLIANWSMRQAASAIKRNYSIVLLILLVVIEVLFGHELYNFFKASLPLYYRDPLSFPKDLVIAVIASTVVFLTNLVQLFTLYPLLKSIAVRSKLQNQEIDSIGGE
jgi:hypothetical protein